MQQIFLEIYIITLGAPAIRLGVPHFFLFAFIIKLANVPAAPLAFVYLSQISLNKKR